MTAHEIFHSHLEVCDHCMSHPFDLCIIGRKLMADLQGEGTGTGVHVTEDLSDSDVEATGQFLFGLPVMRVKAIDLNRLYSRCCNDFLCKGHMVMLAINTMPIGYLRRRDDGRRRERRSGPTAALHVSERGADFLQRDSRTHHRDRLSTDMAGRDLVQR